MLWSRRRAAHMLSFTLASHTLNIGKTYIYLFIWGFFFPSSGSTLTPAGHPGSHVSPSIIQRVDGRPEAAGLLATSQETCRCRARSPSDRFSFFLFSLLGLHSWLTVLKLNPSIPGAASQVSGCQTRQGHKSAVQQEKKKCWKDQNRWAIPVKQTGFCAPFALFYPVIRQADRRLFVQRDEIAA